MNKYKDKNGISLNYQGDDSHKVLVREVVEEAIKILGMYDRNCKISMGMAMMNTKKFLKTNFDISSKSERSDEWRIEQFNRNRSMEDQVNTIKELENKTNEIPNS